MFQNKTAIDYNKIRELKTLISYTASWNFK